MSYRTKVVLSLSAMVVSFWFSVYFGNLEKTATNTATCVCCAIIAGIFLIVASWLLMERD
jgi:hypothetical protein